MKMAPFRYHRPETVDEAVELLAEHGDEAKVLAGGQSLVPLLALRLSRPEHLIDIGKLGELEWIDIHDGGVAIGALARHSDVEHSELIARRAPLVGGAMPFIGHHAIRNQGTACGSLAHADPAAELPAVAVAVDAELVLRSARQERIVPAADFFLGYLSSAIAEDELLTEVRLPAWPDGTGWSVQEMSRRHGDFALVGLVMVLGLDGSGKMAHPAIALLGAGSVPVRARGAEKLLLGETPGDEVFAAAASAVSQDIDPPGDIHASANYRRHVAGVLTQRALVEAASRTGAPKARAQFSSSRRPSGPRGEEGA
jgi:carbon-monoxide dehydrogenase medium subunit